LSDNLTKILKDWINYMRTNGLKNPKGLLFPSQNGTYMSARNFNQRNLARATKEINPDIKVTPHDFRNFNNSMNTLVGMPVEERMALLGHGDAKTNAIYNKEKGWINRADKISQANNLSNVITLKSGRNNLIGS
jgi:site-specific recombinase XerD